MKRVILEVGAFVVAPFYTGLTMMFAVSEKDWSFVMGIVIGIAGVVGEWFLIHHTGWGWGILAWTTVWAIGRAVHHWHDNIRNLKVS